MRLRQLVLVAENLEPLASQLQSIFDLGEGYHDPNIIHFGLDNYVIPVGDTFLEIVAPVKEGTTASRYMKKHGAGGYMVIVQVPDTESLRSRIEELGIRVVWKADHEGIDGTHLHPKDTGGAILSLDEARPRESWQWAGPSWEEHSNRTQRVTQLIGATLESPNPRALAERWAAICARPLLQEDSGRAWRLEWEDDQNGFLRFTGSSDGRREGLSEFWMKTRDPGAILASAREHGCETDTNGFDLGGIRFRV